MKIPPLEVKVRTKGYVKIDPKNRRLIDHETLRGVDFSSSKYQQFTSVGSRFEGCSFEKVRIENASFGAGQETSEYISCNFDGMRVRYMHGGYTRFVRCTFRNVDLREWYAWSTELIDCIFSGRLRGGIFSGAIPEDDQSVVRRRKNEFHGNDFSEMKLEGVDFRGGIDLTQQKLPNGSEYLYLPDAEAAVRRARADVITWRDLDKRREAMLLVKVLEEEIQNGQQQLLLRLEDYGKSFREVGESVFASLRGPELGVNRL